MISSVVGFDIGYSSCYIGIARGGGIEIIDNEYSKRDNPTYVGYGACSDGRKMALSAKSQMSSNIKSTILGFKPLIGREFEDPMTQGHITSLFNDFEKQSDGSIGFRVDYEDKQIVLTPENVTSSLLVYLKSVAEAKLGFAVNDCVISVPLYFCDYQRRAMLFAAKTAGLNVLRLMNDTSAIALAYGIYKQDLPAEKEKSRLVVFVDIGDNDTQISAVGFNKGRLDVKKSLADPQLGGRHFGERICAFFKTEFTKKYNINVDSRARAAMRLQTECEKLKKTMSANTTDIPLNIECFMNDIDVTGRMNKDQFEELTHDLFERLRHLLQELLYNAPFTVEDIDAVEIVGGSTRIPKCKAIIEEVLHKTCSTTLNADEAAARGCALQCAILSPAFKVRDFAINDIVQSGIKLVWYNPDGTVGGDMEVFAKGHVFPFSKMLTFYRKENLILEASYSTPVQHTQTVIGRFEVGPIKPAEDGSSTKVKVKVKVDIHGILTVESAHTVTKIQVPIEEEKKEEKKEVKKAEKKEGDKMETEEAENGVKEESKPNENEADLKAEKIEKADSDDKMKVENGSDDIISEDKKKPKTKTKTVQNPLEVTISKKGFTAKELQEAVERENAMISTDKLIKDRLMAKNAVEEYVYEMRDKLYSKLENFISESDKDVYLAELSKTENWLYDEGENCQKQVYIDKLAELRKVGDRIMTRYTENEGRQGALNLLGTSLVHVRKVLDLIRNKDEKYDHLSEEDIKTLAEKDAEFQGVFNDFCNKATSQKLDEDPLITVAQINLKRKEFEDKCYPIVNKPKPKVEPPPVPADEPKVTKEEEKDTPMESTDANATPEQPQEQPAPAADPAAADPTSMELD